MRSTRTKVIDRGLKGKNNTRLFVLLIPCVALSVQAQEAPIWKARAAYSFQDLSFADDAHGANFLLAYDRAREWGVRGGFHYINKFGDSAPGYDVGGTYWLTGTTVVSFDAEFAPGHVVIPRQAYMIELSQVIFKTLVPSVAYKFSDYRDADAHIVMPSVTWYFFRRWDWMVKYFLAFSRFAHRDFTNHSMMTRLNWNVIDVLWLFGGYARSSANFETGSPYNRFGGFTAHHGFGGFKWMFYKGLGVDATYSFENRSNDTRLHSLDVGIFFAW